MENNMSMAEAQLTPPAAAAVQLTDLVYSLEQATQMAKQLPVTSDPTYLFQIHSSLHRAHHSLSSFLSAAQTQFPVPPHPQHLPPPVAAENSLSSATGAANENGSDPMQVGDENETEAEENSKTSIDKVEERMRECFFIKNKRVKRQLSPSSAALAEERRVCDDRFVGGIMGFDPAGEKLRALDLVYQFHG
ncbi:hypothetical protein ERO13_A08G129400v2 [Gossypium hirsutum]|uniref:Uncharacterized protein n=5 Tax=Gossypium TaxID=3633 RepID=A0A2P5YUP7_GOSBA|nr:uncharacterized protein LOC107887222 [Gossypium hirsutum]XP_017626974.1 uncharacterized protein LOC108470212 [Gossypium arboreum]KAB2070194.1 hypothetical protein ES319_A08G140300v1 [Gossypium barbadense]TYH06400.1 hypothetical protein ES288_A08G153700v1 [Gossypium darwinii]KAG4187897.1 hypothetical protein ERO13_A08G129400v2 [Gossypium hirsutum]KAK5812555.1 hypothetical protein PVK06_027990 [Gossypium arboreum]PPS19328.1 hypothetical protein GOBAR_AA01243 [Gossypium barbadense]